MLRRLAAASLLCAAVVAAPATAHAGYGHYKSDLNIGANVAPDGAIPVQPDVPPPAPGGTGRIPDLGFKATPGRARRAQRLLQRMDKVETYEDQHGHAITIETDNDAVDLRPFAAILAATYHDDEISRLYVGVISNAGVSATCGAQAVACYFPRRNSPEGLMVVSYQDDDIAHTMFHEYGHHMDNQLYNLDGRAGCRFDNDGSRRWFFTRDLEDRILERTTCNPDADWSSLLGELYAEDYAQLSAQASGTPISGFDPRMPAPPPTPTVLASLRRDIDRPFVPHTRKLRGSFRRRTVKRTIGLDAPSFLRLTSASEIRRAKASGCATPYQGVYRGRCTLSLTRKGRARRYRVGVRIY
jgi:hypothetical protein